MALQGQSTSFATAGSPPRLINGQPESHFPPPIFGHPRPMLPPSPQQFPRYQPQPIHHTQMALPGSLYDIKAPTPQHVPPPPISNPHKRPGSSMSISSMLGGEPERTHHDLQSIQNNHGPRNASVSQPGIPVGNMMSPPHQPLRVGLSEYPYKRSQTPDRIDSVFQGNRQRSASSGTSMAPNRAFYEHDRYTKPPAPTFHPAPLFSGNGPTREEQDERNRSASLSAILQRPSSQPQSFIPALQTPRNFDPLPPQRHNWYADPPPTVHEMPRHNGYSGTYDTKPPGFRDIPRTIPASQSSPSAPPPNPVSPELRRISNGSYSRGLANILNGPTSQPPDMSATNMMRQDSAQSHSDRSIQGDRRFRHFSPFAGPAGPYMQGFHDEPGRKGSEEISHKAIIGLGLENRRSRYSPVPQAVQGAQASTPVPDGGNPRDQGKVFSGIGGGIGSSSTPVPVSSSPFKSNDTALRATEVPKTGRASSNTGKRSRKTQDDELRADGDQEGKRSSKATKRARYKQELAEEMATPSHQRKGTPGLSAGRATNSASNAAVAASITRYDAAPIFKPKKTVKVATLASQILRKPRRHLGSFQYNPEILVPHDQSATDTETEICIKPKLLPSFSETNDLNCTYTIHVSKTWLQQRERRIICASRNLWGTGLYTDDTDPVTAAMHMGWIKPAFHNVDETLLKKIVHDQNPKIEISKDLKPPAQPLEIPKGRDLKITCVVMPLLDHYEETSRFGVRSRAWPEGLTETTAPHDGVSFAILKVEVVELGPEERRMGRTGTSKRARLKEQLLARERARQSEKERVARLTKKLRDEAEKRKFEEVEKNNNNNKNKKSRAASAKAPSPLSNEVHMDVAPAPTDPTITTTPQSAPPALPPAVVALSEEEWIRQLATAAA
ncbi:hypothetical protein LTS08_007075 [Lithohypha guttulata]|nr:hypothetical protein LTS08_007075 [Lithohypha guttulata]